MSLPSTELLVMWCSHCNKETTSVPTRTADGICCALCGEAYFQEKPTEDAIRQARDIIARWSSSDLLDRISTLPEIPPLHRQASEAEGSDSPAAESADLSELAGSPSRDAPPEIRTKPTQEIRLTASDDSPAESRPNLIEEVLETTQSDDEQTLFAASQDLTEAAVDDPSPVSGSQSLPGFPNVDSLFASDTDQTDHDVAAEDPGTDDRDAGEPATDNPGAVDVVPVDADQVDADQIDANLVNASAAAAAHDAHSHGTEPIDSRTDVSGTDVSGAMVATEQSTAARSPVPLPAKQQSQTRGSLSTSPTNPNESRDESSDRSADSATQNDESVPAVAALQPPSRRVQQPRVAQERATRPRKQAPSATDEGTKSMSRKFRIDTPGGERAEQPESDPRNVAGTRIQSNSKSGRRHRIDTGSPVAETLETGDRRSRTQSRPRRRYIDEAHDSVARGPHFQVTAPRRSNFTSITGQFLAYIGVLGLTVGTAMVIYGHFGGYSEYTPTGWLVTTVAQMMLFLGVINLVSGGMEQTNSDVSQRMEYLGSQLMRIEQVAEEALRGPKISAQRYADPDAAVEASDREQALVEE